MENITAKEAKKEVISDDKMEQVSGGGLFSKCPLLESCGGVYGSACCWECPLFLNQKKNT